MSAQQTPAADLAASISGQSPHQVDRELAQLLASTYTLAAHRRDPSVAVQALPPGWQPVEGPALAAAGISPADLNDAKSGFDAALYRNEQGLVVLAFNGTDQGRDWRSNLRQGLGLTDVQYDQAVALTSKANQVWGPELVLSGHSLGGGLAAAAGMVHEVPTVTFNAAGVHDSTLERFDCDAGVLKQQARDGLVRSYEVRNELLTYLQEDNLLSRWVMPDAPGHRIELPDPDPKNLFERMVPGVMLKHRLDLHGIDAVLQAQQLAGLEERPWPVPSQDNGQQLLLDAARGLSVQRAPLGLHDDNRFFNTASHVAAHASQDGLQRIDHLLLTPDQQRLVAIQGGRDDPAQQRSVVLAEAAAREPALHSYQRLEHTSQQAAQEQAASQQTQRSNALSH
ncbi:hypothetical protein ABB30_07395 [Stenotrophomonas ginsengisoli]|uniref:X-Tfes XVIPCD domain-containing protein n=1 Tax=Stenotrophomonas ginsengisoli TaxID=336566 RepID=A0A0R0DHT2_9GAMM|nr:XVIPCD domain-containing protein [Stenotrophomonas ginsengisoli]KRG77428.1 hypothetical protein ABB30_07395 [Stenotrophomonas ginsengisoli]